MIRTEVSSLGYTLTKEHPATVEEYNALAPKRANACLEDAVASTDYRSVFPVFRDTLLTELGETYGVPRENFGTEDDPKWETEGKWFNRIVAKSGKTPEQFRSETLTVAQKHMDAAAFDPSERESKGSGPTIGKRDLALAQQVITDGKADVIAGKLAVILGRDVATDEKSLARAIADNRRALAEKAAQEQKAALGL